MLEISVVLPTRNSANWLTAVLDGFRQQSLPQPAFEIITVDDGSTDDTPQILNCARSTLPLRVFRQRHAGLAAAKNLGLFASRGAIVLFADEDKVAGPELLFTHLSAHRSHPEPRVAVLGPTRLAADLEKNPVMRHVTGVGDHLSSNDGMKLDLPLSYTAFTGGTSCKRAFLIDVGIFNPRLGCGCEYTELAYRLRPFQLVYEPAAACLSNRIFGFRELCERQEELGRAERKFAELHPTADVLQYCQIDERSALWRQKARGYSHYLSWVASLDEMAQSHADAVRPMPSVDQAVLDDAYRTAFALCRAKGVALPDHKQSSSWRSRFVQLLQTNFEKYLRFG